MRARRWVALCVLVAMLGGCGGDGDQLTALSDADKDRLLTTCIAAMEHEDTSPMRCAQLVDALAREVEEGKYPADRASCVLSGVLDEVFRRPSTPMSHDDRIAGCVDVTATTVAS